MPEDCVPNWRFNSNQGRCGDPSVQTLVDLTLQGRPTCNYVMVRVICAKHSHVLKARMRSCESLKHNSERVCVCVCVCAHAWGAGGEGKDALRAFLRTI